MMTAMDAEGSDPIPAWTPIQMPTEAELAYSSPATTELANLAEAWRSQRSRLEETSPEGLREFVSRLVRSWAIETGIIERLYDLDEGTTQTLVEHGFRADLLGRSDSSLAPEDLLALLNSHVAAADMVKDVVAHQRPLSKHFIRELHQLLTHTQTHTQARTPDGKLVETPMIHGDFKKWPNNPERADGAIREYAPPEQVESEMDQLIAGVQLLEGESPALQAAWIHHRFTQIHPFQDGNGRVARALTNMAFIGADLFPVVVSRDDRVRYIDALESADRGSLGPLIDLFADIECRTIVRALSVAADEQRGARASTVDAVLDRMVVKFGEQIRNRESVLRGVNDVALKLRDHGLEQVQATGQALTDKLRQTGARLKVHSSKGGPDFDNQHFWRFQATSIARDLGYWVNFQEDQYWFRIAFEGMPVRFQFVVLFHHVGHELSGVVQAGAFAEFEVPRPAGTGSRKTEATGIERTTKNCTPRAFTITWQSAAEAEAPRFDAWLDESLAVALRYWMDLA